MLTAVISRLVMLLFGTLYPAYASYKAVKTKNVKEYVKWMMYWIVFALFTVVETFADVFLAFWFPFYYEIKIILVVWLLSPATKGSSILYRKFVHPQLAKREAEIDEYLARATEQGYNTVFRLGLGGINFASQLLVRTAMQGGGNLVDQLRRSYSMNNLSITEQPDDTRPKQSHRVRALTLNEGDEVDMVDALPLRSEAADTGFVASFFRKSVTPTSGRNNNMDDSDSEVDSPTQSSGYVSATAAVKVEPAEEATAFAEPARRTRSNTRTGTGATSRKKATTQEVYGNTLPRTKKTTRKKIPVFDQE